MECEHIWIPWRSWELCEKCGMERKEVESERVE